MNSERPGGDPDENRTRKEVTSQWMPNYERLLSWVLKYGRLPRKSDGGRAASLRRWIDRERGENLLRLHPEQRRLLDLVADALRVRGQNFWEPRLEKWWQHADEVEAFLRREGQPPLSSSSDTDEKKLGKWLSKQRRRNRDGRLDTEQRGWLRHVPVRRNRGHKPGR